jgi:hypothetical protein
LIRFGEESGFCQYSPDNDVHRIVLAQAPGHQRLQFFAAHGADGGLVGDARLIVANNDDGGVAGNRLAAHNLGTVHVAARAGGVPLRRGKDLADGPVPHSDAGPGQPPGLGAVQADGLLHADVIVAHPVGLDHQFRHPAGGHIHLHPDFHPADSPMGQVELVLKPAPLLHNDVAGGENLDAAVGAVVVGLRIAHRRPRPDADRRIHDMLKVDRVGESTVGQETHLRPFTNLKGGENLLDPLLRDHPEAQVDGVLHARARVHPDVGADAGGGLFGLQVDARNFVDEEDAVGADDRAGDTVRLEGVHLAAGRLVGLQDGLKVARPGGVAPGQERCGADGRRVGLHSHTPRVTTSLYTSPLTGSQG